MQEKHYERKSQSFEKGLNSDVSPANQPSGTYRSAVNMELTSYGDQNVINQIKSSLEVASEELTSGASIEAINILGYTPSKALNQNNEIVDGFVVYTLAKKANTEPDCAILFFEQTGNSTQGVIHPICRDSDLFFPISGSIDSFFTQNNDNLEVFFTDNVNEIRSIPMKMSLWPLTARQLSAAAFSLDTPSISVTSIGNDGSLLAGSYQFSFRLKNSNTLRYTDWSLFTNPVSIIPQTYTTGTTDAFYGGLVGQQTTKSISFNIYRGALEAGGTYDAIDIAVIKNNDGSKLEQTVAYVYSISNTGNTGNLTTTYYGTETETTLEISEIVVPDTPVKSVKTLIEKDGRILAGNVTYHDLRIGNAEGVVTDARTIRRAVDYQDPINTEKYKGYWRDEVYRFGVTYHDKYGNWSPVKPLDFSTFNKLDVVNATTINGNIESYQINYDTNTFRVTASNNWPSGFVVGGSARFTNVVVSGISFPSFTSEIVNISNQYLYALNPAKMWANYQNFQNQATGTVTVAPIKGNNRNHSGASNSWKFPKREHIGVLSTGATGTYGTHELGSYSLTHNITTPSGKTYAQALGLGVTITNHPSWAVGVAIVRMERDRDIIYQSPVIPAALNVGNITPGKSVTGTAQTRDYSVNAGIGELDHLSPKVLKLGVARNMGIMTIPCSKRDTGTTTAVATNDSYQLLHWLPSNSVPQNRLMWKKFFFPAVDYVYNSLGTPLIETPNSEGHKVEMIDVCGFTLSSLTPVNPITIISQSSGMTVTKPSGYVDARVYECDVPDKHWYNNATGYINMRTQTTIATSSTSNVTGTYQNTAWRKINESILASNGVYSSSYVGTTKYANMQSRFASNGPDKYIYAQTLMDLDNLFTTEKIIPIPKGSPKILLDIPEKGTGGGSVRSAAEYLIAGEELTNQQKNSSISSDPAMIEQFSSGIDYQRNMVVTINQPLEDPLYMLTAHYSVDGVGQFGYVPRDTTNTGTTGTLATVPFAGWLHNSSGTSGTSTRELRNGLIYVNPFMNITYNGSLLPTGFSPSTMNFPYLAATGLSGSPRAYYAPHESPDAGVSFYYTNNNNSVNSWTKVAPSALVNEDIQQALYVANLKIGKTDFRYGDPNKTQEYIYTGAYSKIASTGAQIALSVWGGDCFISKYRYKVNDEYNVPAYYKPTASGTYGLDFNLTDYCDSFITSGNVASTVVFKTGIKKSPEYIELFMESEANAFYNAEENRYPYFNATGATAGTESQYQGDAFYEYNYGYSIQNLNKKFYSENRSITKSDSYPARIIYSDKRDETSLSDGFSKFRLENFYDMEQKYGKISRICLLSNDSPIIGQDSAISMLLVNKSLTTLQNNELLSVQSGVYISDDTPPKYFTTNYGAELLRCMISTESGVFLLDTKRGTLIGISNEIKLLPVGRMEEYFRSNFSNAKYPWGEHEIQLSYDSVDKTLYVIGAIEADAQYPSSDNYQWLSYNVSKDAFVSNLVWSVQAGGHGGKYFNKPYFHFDLNGTTYVLQSHSGQSQHNVIDLHVNNWKGANDFLRLLTGNHIAVNDATIEYVVNHEKGEPKVIDIVGIDGQDAFVSYRVKAYNDTSTYGTLDTGTQSLNINKRFGMTSTSFLRDSATSRRLTGTYAVVTLAIGSAISKIVSIKSAFTQFRKLLRW